MRNAQNWRDSLSSGPCRIDAARFRSGEIVQGVNIVGRPCRPTVAGELVRLDFNASTLIATTLNLPCPLIPLVNP